LRALGRLAADLRPILLVLLIRLERLVFFIARGCAALDFFFFAILAIAAVSLSMCKRFLFCPSNRLYMSLLG
jgi:hypothetical protein